MASQDVPQGRVRRTMPLAGFTARAAGGRLVAGLREKSGDAGAVERFHERTAERYADLLGHSKGVLMKLGQLASLVDMQELGTGGFAPYQKALTRLQADAPPMSSHQVRGVIEAQLKCGLATFAEFDDDPIAAASIGQVHRAMLHDGRPVAVKVQYPGVAQAIRSDLANTELVATFLRFAMSASGMVFDPRALAKEFALRIAEEVDYRREAHMIGTFSELYRAHPFIRVPDVVPEGCSNTVLTMTHMDGIGWQEAQHAEQTLRNRWAEILIRFGYGNLRHANLLHADPHPGNYRFGLDGRVGFVDFGCVKVLPERMRWLWVAISRAALEERSDELYAYITEAGFLTPDSSLSPADALRYWRHVLNEMVAEPQPVTFTPESGAHAARWLFGIDSSNPVSRMHAPDDYAFAPRVVQAVTNACGALHATLLARSIADDMDGVVEPVTELGKLHHGWVRERGLPGALDDHTAHNAMTES